MESANLDLVRVIMIIPLILSLSVHEFAHAWSAYMLGDDTAARQGRLTLNPVPHIDPIGTLLLPLVFLLSGSPISFGWAKPVPVNPAGFRRNVSMSTGMMLTAAAGPISNVVLAILSTVAYGLLARWNHDWLLANAGVSSLLLQMIGLNVGLALFNALPVPPLDGSRVVEGLLPYRLRDQWANIQRYAPIALIFVMFYGGRLIAGPSRYVLGLLGNLLQSIVA
ncbi:MAG TPA: site-2 protease family protein [Myxococcaceae bacterium]|nr:site-2 protease family protein [Myxococcaceae bacterium]